MAEATYLLAPVISTGYGNPLALDGSKFSLQAKVAGSGVVTATITVQVSNDQVEWFEAAVFILSGTTKDQDAASIEAPFAWIRAYVNEISGTSAQASVYIRASF